MDILISNPVDWNGVFVPAVLALLRGDPITTIYNPPWVLAPLIPFALLPDGSRWMSLAALLAMCFTVWKLGGSPIALASFLVNPITLNVFMSGNIEWLVLLGFALPLPVGLLLMALKPQITFLVVLMFVSRKNLRAFLPLAIIALASILIFPSWITNLFSYSRFHGSTDDASFFPYLIPLALFLVYKGKAMAASPMFSPALSTSCWTVAVLSLVRHRWASVAFALGSWVFFLLRAKP